MRPVRPTARKKISSMNSLPKKWPSIRKDQRVEIGLVQVDIGAHSKQYDHFTDLVLKRAKDVLKDALVTSAEGRGGQLASWEDDSGTFLFLIDGPDSLNNCCLAAMEMLEQLPSVKQEVQLSGELERLIIIRMACDIGTLTYDAEARSFAGDFLDEFKKHEHAVSAENQVTITERIFCQLKNPVKSRFGKWKHSPELGVDLYAAAEAPVKLALADLSSEQANPAEEEQARPGGLVPTPASERSSTPKRFELVSQALQSRKALSTAAVVLALLVIGGLVRYFVWPTARPTDPALHTPVWEELVQSPEWRTWRKQIHEKLSAGKVTEKTLAEALQIKLPPRPDNAAAALRRDQAIADVLMTYPPVKQILWKRFGIDENGFLGTGLSKPSSSKSNYGAASVHEYLIRNLPDNHPAVWMRILDPNKNPKDMTMTVQELFEKDPKPDDQKKELIEGIAQRVKEKDTVNPVMIRFARLDAGMYSRKLGRSASHLVFASNLAEVWNTRVTDAAILSGHTFTKGDSVYIWVFLPNHPDEAVPATWGEVLNRLPKWLSEMDTD
jgi:hypothetical protein